MSHTVFLSLGTNLGDRQANLEAAAAALPPGMLPEAFSPIYETAPWGYADQPAFLNQVVRAATDLPPMDLLAYLKDLETRLGRRPSFRFGPRLIDLDILIYDDLQLSTPELTLPHPRLAERAFVLAPLADLAPEWVHPHLGKSVRELLAGLDRSGVKRFSIVDC